MLTITEYATRHDKSTRTVQRWLERDQLPGAVFESGRWQIPADVLPMTASGPGVTVATSRAPVPPTPLATLAGALDACPAYLDVPTAAALLGLTESAVRAHAQRLGGIKWTGSWLIPQATVRQAAGL